MENTVKITLWDNTVGYLTWDSSDWRKESSVFKFDSSFLEKGLDISPLQMSINSPARKAGIPVRGGNPKDIFKGLPPVFADSLPDHWGNSIFRAWAKEHGVSMKRISPVDMLAFVGRRAMGALEYHPSLVEYEDEACNVDVQKLYMFARSVLDERTRLTFSSDRELLWQDLVKLGTSPGGKRPKALIAINRENGDVKSGQAMLPQGYDYYILKYDNESDSFPYARMEYVYWRLCKDAGIEIMDSELKRFGNANHFITRRFDRGPEGKVHMQSLLAMAGNVTSYEEAFDTMRKLDLGYKDFEQLYRRMVFNVLAGNIDDHARNFSFIMDRTGRWSLAPAYDMVFSIDPSVLEVQKGQFLSICGKRSEIKKEDLIYIGRYYDINRPGEVIERTQDVLSHLHGYMKEEGISDSVWQMVSAELRSKDIR